MALRWRKRKDEEAPTSNDEALAATTAEEVEQSTPEVEEVEEDATAPHASESDVEVEPQPSDGAPPEEEGEGIDDNTEDPEDDSEEESAGDSAGDSAEDPGEEHDDQDDAAVVAEVSEAASADGTQPSDEDEVEDELHDEQSEATEGEPASGSAEPDDSHVTEAPAEQDFLGGEPDSDGGETEPEDVEPQDLEPEQDEPEQDEPEQDEPEQDEPEQDEPEQDEPEVVAAELDEPQPDDVEPGSETVEPDDVEPDAEVVAADVAPAVVAAELDEPQPDDVEPDAEMVEPEDVEPDAEVVEPEPDDVEPAAVETPAADGAEGQAQDEAGPAAYGEEGQDPGRGPVSGMAAWGRLLRMARPRATKANVLGAVLAIALGAAIATQVQLTNERGLNELSQPELVRLLDNVTLRSSRLDTQIRELESTRDRLRSGTGTTAEALRQAQRRADTLGILAGTVGAQGPGITITISDPDAKVPGITVLDLIQELRDAGAESIDVGGVRVVASSFVGDSGGDLSVDGQLVARPIIVKAIGDPKTLSSAMSIPGGIVQTIRQKGANATVQESGLVSITSLHAATDPTHARPTG